jgi:hypothetical protein
MLNIRFWEGFALGTGVAFVIFILPWLLIRLKRKGQL